MYEEMKMINPWWFREWLDALVVIAWVGVWTFLAFFYPFGELLIN
jgi:hypothetical protein